MNIDLFDFDLPSHLIAQFPASPRESAKLLICADDATFSDSTIANLPALIDPQNDVLIFNNTKVIPAFLVGLKGQMIAKINLHKQVNTNTWHCFVKKSAKYKTGDAIVFNNSPLSGAVIANLGEGAVAIEFNFSGDELLTHIENIGQMPLPPYIKRDKIEASDFTNYQTIYAKHKGAVAAPTAGLHFTENIIHQLQNKGVAMEFVTLHVGAGTFLPVKVQNIKDHHMHSEQFYIEEDVAERINTYKKQGKNIICVGTTSLRALESACDSNGILSARSSSTDIFIYPGYKFKIVDKLITNFHLPKSTLFMLISAFSGRENMLRAYKHAINNNYRFFSYGDCCFLNRIK